MYKNDALYTLICYMVITNFFTSLLKIYFIKSSDLLAPMETKFTLSTINLSLDFIFQAVYKQSSGTIIFLLLH